MTVTNTPLAHVDPDSVKYIFDANPNTLPDDDFRTLIIELRRRRSAFASDEAAKAAKGKKERLAKTPVTASAAATLDVPAGELTLDDLT